MEADQKGTFVNLVNFPPIRSGEEAEFLEWFRWTNEVYARHKGFISRTFLKPTEGPSGYAAIVEHESKDTSMAMHLGKDREEEAFKGVEPLFEGSTPHFCGLEEMKERRWDCLFPFTMIHAYTKKGGQRCE
jgi:antibiotic biosynthesis monooxygenase (ABM) superfamily enzyme